MITRRDWLLGAAAAGSLAAAELLRPRKTVVLMPQGASLATIIPDHVQGFRLGGSGNFVLPPSTEGGLSQRLYGDQLGRIYQPDGDPSCNIMLLLAYGGAQTDSLQLHRPESCYPAFGYRIADRRFAHLSTPSVGKVPVVALKAEAESRTEDVLYWTRIGRDLPVTSDDQRRARLRAAMQGYVGDGILVRASAVRVDGRPMFAQLAHFLEALIESIPAGSRVSLVGR